MFARLRREVVQRGREREDHGGRVEGVEGREDAHIALTREGGSTEQTAEKEATYGFGVVVA